MSVACFDTLVGLSKTDYECFTGDAPEGFDTSDSGYHLTDTDYGLTIAEQCTVDGWGMLAAARTQAVLEIKSELRAALRDRYDGAITPFSGVVGQLTSTGTLAVTKDFLGRRIRARKQKGAKFVLKKIYLGLNVASTYSVNIRSNDPLFTNPSPVSITVSSTTSMTAHTLSSQIELPFFSRACEDKYIEYYITVQRGSARPLNNKITCCGARPGWKNHFESSGFEASDNIATDGQMTSMGYGLAIDGYMACEELDWICEADELGGFHLKDVLARAIQFRGAAIAISDLIDQFSVNPCTGYQLDALNSKRGYLNKRSAEYVQWISQNIPHGVTDCFTCKPEAMFHVSKTLV